MFLLGSFSVYALFFIMGIICFNDINLILNFRVFYGVGQKLHFVFLHKPALVALCCLFNFIQSKFVWLYCDNCHINVHSVQFSCSVVSDSLQPHGLQHISPPCPSRVYSNSCPLSQWCHPTILSSVIPSPPTFNISHYHGLF